MSFTAYFPSLRELDLADNLLTEVPPVVAKTTKLTYLYKEFAHESLTTLGLSRTNLSKFDVYLPNLTKLYLDGNSLTEIPPIVFSHTKLREFASGSRGVDGGTSIGGTSASSSSSLPAVLGGVIGALALALVGGFVYCKKKRKGDGTRTINRFDANRTTKSNGDGNKIADVAILQMVASGELRPSVSPSCPEEIAELAQLCLSVRPEDRPSAPEVAYALRSYKKRMIALSA
ncbi:hypothetical protein PybrP1_009295 [[Pythium] brassicae (nom. inval.)]|nr:hypothetical protein PybrP1_009295 [[Pythium] brassicae (nom. inval.)]